MGYEGLYEISSDGHVRSLGRIQKSSAGWMRPVKGRDIRPQISIHGYKMFHLRKGYERKVRYAHWLVATHFIGAKPRNHEINHKDGDKLNNSVSNLEFCSRSYNCHHAHKVLMRNQGSNSGSAKLNESLVREIFRKVQSGRMQKEVAKEYGVSNMTVSLLSRGKTWRHVTDRTNWLAELPACAP